MNLNSAKNPIFQQCKTALKKWFLLSVVVTVVVVVVCFFLYAENRTCVAVLNFSYSGIEAGLDPDGNRFNQTDINSEKLVRQAAETIREDVTDEDVERFQNALEIKSSVSDEIFQEMTTHTSIYEDEAILKTEKIDMTSYFPSQYVLKFHYWDAGFSRSEGLRYVDALLNAYEQYFYNKYGYSTSLENSLISFDYRDYDYVDAADILDRRMTSLRIYLSQLIQLDNTRFISKSTGYSFSDIMGTINTIQEEDIHWIQAYITSNNVTKERESLINYYQYKIEDAQRALVQQDSRLYTLNNLIETYVKTTAVFPFAGENGQQESSSAYEFSQPSYMYDSLINQKVACQTTLSETQERIAYFERRIERLQNIEVSGDSAIVEARLEVIDGKINQLLSDLRETADEFFKTVWLKRAVQVSTGPKISLGLGFVLKQSLSVLLIVESALLGIFILFALKDVKPRRAETRGRAGEEGTV